jgi:hypothetical protein
MTSIFLHGSQPLSLHRGAVIDTRRGVPFVAGVVARQYWAIAQRVQPAAAVPLQAASHNATA